MKTYTTSSNFEAAGKARKVLQTLATAEGNTSFGEFRQKSGGAVNKKWLYELDASAPEVAS